MARMRDGFKEVFKEVLLKYIEKNTDYGFLTEPQQSLAPAC